ncbi:MAG TPA: hypothetical protein VM900_02430 [Sphingomonas sp.]|nr:hypothetical protein [Sphingomonas sp.]
MTDVATRERVERRVSWSWVSLPRLAPIAGVAILVLALLARVLTYPMGHDEQIHVAASRLIFDAPLYRTLGYNHLPGLPRLLGSIYAIGGVTHLLLVGRLLIFACWIATGATILWIARRAGAGAGIAGLACLLLAATPLLGPAGMLVTNNFLPVPFALIAVQSLMCALGRDAVQRPFWAALAGAGAMAAVLLKISFVALVPPLAIAALLVPFAPGPTRRVTQILLPAAAGALLALLPALPDLLHDPAGAYLHTVRYFLGPHRAYWQQATAPKAMSIADKILTAEQVWLAGGGLLASLLAGALGWLGRPVASRRFAPDWRLALLAGTAATFAVMSFAPTPAFPQYYLPPIPFVVMFVVVAYGRLDEAARGRARPFLVVAGLLALAVVAPRLGSLRALATPSHWTVFEVHRDANRARAAIAGSQGTGFGVATLSPIRALEAGLRPYPEFAAGPFVYRVADFIPPDERQAYATTSAAQLPAFLDVRQPAAIVTGDEPDLDPRFEAYALARGYRQVPLAGSDMRLFVLPGGRRDAIPLQSSPPR